MDCKGVIKLYFDKDDASQAIMIQKKMSFIDNC